MANLVLPEEVIVQLVDDKDQPIQLANVHFSIGFFARQKNDFSLGPYVSDDTGKVVITREDIEYDIVATYDSGLMDFAPIEQAFTMIEIRLDHPDDIESCLVSRSTSWTSLLKGEKERWGTIESLIDTYRSASNYKLNVWKGFSKIRDDWDGSNARYHYDFKVQIKQGAGSVL